MTPMVETVRKLLHQKPFRPFQVVMKSGERHEINDPDQIAVSRIEIHWFGEKGKWARMKVDEIDIVYEPRRTRNRTT